MSEINESPFLKLGLREELAATLSGLGYEQPTPIQEKTIPALLAGRDIIGQAQTGTGKTAAFALPLLTKIDPEQTRTQALILTPTRELAMQVAEAVHSYGKGLGVTVLPVYGGAPIGAQLHRLHKGVQVVVGTPGRLIDHLDRGSLDPGEIRYVVLDEADEMLRMGFLEDVEKILGRLPEDRQTALFSATMPKEIQRIAQKHLRDPEKIEVEHRQMTTALTEQRYLNLSEGQKLEVLTQMLELEPGTAVLVFRRTRTGAAELAERLEARGFPAVAMHGDMNQSLRESVIRRLKSGQVEIVVATDVAARGLDVEQITHVVNYDVPNDVEAYVHRIGRTGRAGRSGLATIFVTPRERRMVREIERFTGSAIKPMKMPTRADVAEKRIETFKESIRKELAAGDLELYLGLVEAIAEEGSFDIAEVAAAAARIANGSRSLVPEPEPAYRELPPPPLSRHPRPAGMDRPPHARREFTSAEPGRARPERRPRREDGPTVALEISAGHNQGLRPGDIVGSIANEANISGKEIGPIEIQDDRSIVYVPADKKDQVLEAMRGAMFKGTALDVRPEGAAASPAGPPRRPRKAPGSDFRSPGRPPARETRGAPMRETRGAPARDTRGAPARDPRGAPARLPFGRPAAAKPRSRFASDDEPPRSRTTRAKLEKTPHRGKAKPAGRYEKPAPAGAPPSGKRGFYSDFVGGKKKGGKPGKPGGKKKGR